MSSYAITTSRLRASAIALALAVVAAVAIAVLGVLDATRTDSSGAPTSTPGVAPTPEWLQRYLEFEAPAADTPVRSADGSGTGRVNPGLR